MDMMAVDDLEHIVRDKRSLREMFALKFQEWYPSDKAFHTGFALQVLMGKKKLLKLTERGAPSIPKTKETNELDKPNLMNLINQHENLQMYIPDNTKASYISIEFYHCLFYHHKRDLFDYLYSVFERYKKKATQSVKKTMHIEIPSNVSQKLSMYKSNFNVPKSKQFFQLQRFKHLFPDLIENPVDVNMNNNVNINNNRINNDDNLINNHVINRNLPSISERINNSRNQVVIEGSYEYDGLIKSLYNHMSDENLFDCWQLIPNVNDKARHFVKVVDRVKAYFEYENFKLKSTEDQLKLVYRCLLDVVENEIPR